MDELDKEKRKNHAAMRLLRAKSGGELAYDDYSMLIRYAMNSPKDSNDSKTTKDSKRRDEKLTDNYEDHIFMRLLKEDSSKTYNTIKKAIDIKLVVYENGLFNFKCERGCVGAIFCEAGFTESKRINPYILINGKPPAKSTIQNGRKNKEPKGWMQIKKELFPDNP